MCFHCYLYFFFTVIFKILYLRPSLVVEWSRLHAPNAKGPRVQSLVRELDPPHARTKSSHATTKDRTCHSEDQRPHVLQLRPK